METQKLADCFGLISIGRSNRNGRPRTDDQEVSMLQFESVFDSFLVFASPQPICFIVSQSIVFLHYTKCSSCVCPIILCCDKKLIRYAYKDFFFSYNGKPSDSLASVVT